MASSKTERFSVVRFEPSHVDALTESRNGDQRNSGLSWPPSMIFRKPQATSVQRSSPSRTPTQVLRTVRSEGAMDLAYSAADNARLVAPRASCMRARVESAPASSELVRTACRATASATSASSHRSSTTASVFQVVWLILRVRCVRWIAGNKHGLADRSFGALYVRVADAVHRLARRSLDVRDVEVGDGGLRDRQRWVQHKTARAQDQHERHDRASHQQRDVDWDPHTPLHPQIEGPFARPAGSPRLKILSAAPATGAASIH